MSVKFAANNALTLSPVLLYLEFADDELGELLTSIFWCHILLLPAYRSVCAPWGVRSQGAVACGATKEPRRGACDVVVRVRRSWVVEGGR